MIEESIKISIVVTIYNMEMYLERCLTSLELQEPRDIEFILIDDGSRDNSLKICQSFVLRDARFRVIHKENGGVSSARNVGVAAAKGQYIWFVDADDWIASGSVSYIKELIDQYSPDAVCFEHFYNQGEEDVFFKECRCRKMNQEEIVFAVLKERLTHYMCRYVFLRSLYQKGKIYFPENRIYEDTATVPKLLTQCKRLINTTAKIYGYFQHESSATHTMTENNLLNLFLSINEMLEIYKVNIGNEQHFMEAYRCFALNCYVQQYIYVQRVLFEHKSQNLSTLEVSLKEKIKDNAIFILSYSHMRHYSMARNYLFYRLSILKPLLYIQYRLRR